jgi:hypothetical protein
MTGHLDREEWRDIPGIPGYRVSNFGRVASSNWRGRKWMIKKDSPDRNGYPSVNLVGERKERYYLKTAYLVLLAFVGPRPSGRHEIRHLDDDRMNNVLTNLAWGTRAENVADREKNGRVRQGSRHGQAKLSESQVAEILILHESGLSSVDISARFGVTARNIRWICQGKKWRHVQRPAVVLKAVKK